MQKLRRPLWVPFFFVSIAASFIDFLRVEQLVQNQKGNSPSIMPFTTTIVGWSDIEKGVIEV